jgi:threonine dehydratase
MEPLPVSYDDVRSAAARLDGVAHRTPAFTSRTADESCGAHVFFKCENLQRGGAFKFRGAYNALSRLTPEERRRGVVTYSSGNHAQAVALAGRLLAVPTTIVMPADAPAVKLEATRGYGGEVVSYDRAGLSREEIGRRLSAERGLVVIPPYDHAHVIAGCSRARRSARASSRPAAASWAWSPRRPTTPRARSRPARCTRSRTPRRSRTERARRRSED